MGNIDWVIGVGTYAVNGFWYIVTTINVQRIEQTSGNTVYLFGVGCTLDTEQALIADIELKAIARTIYKQ